MKSCIFCKIAEGNVGTSVRADTKHVVAFDSIDPVSEHHILIIPKKHIENFMDLTPANKDLVEDMFKVAQDLVKAMKMQKGYKLLINGGKYQHVNHLHLHLLAGNLEHEDDVLNKT